MISLKDMGELAVIERLTAMLASDARVIVGPGDDCAVVRGTADASADWVLTSDPVVQGVHFPVDATPSGIGHKAIGRVLSDIAAMGARPAWALVNLAAPASTPVRVVEQIYAGMSALAGRHGLCIVGGDLAESPVLELHAFGIGETPRGRAVLRRGAKPGDLVFVTGELGGSLAGRHLTFEPRVTEGQWLRDWASAMIDISDGLAGDLRHITDLSGTGCDLNAAAIPVSEAAKQMPDSRPPLDHALHDGEDFELLFTVPEEKADAFPAAWTAFSPLPCTLIGVMTNRAGLVRCLFPDGESIALERGGFSHFRKC